MNKIEELKELYAQTSKHSNYQILPASLKNILEGDIEVKSRHEPIRLDYMLSHLDFSNKSILDIGGNSGYFTFSLADQGAERVHHYEGNKYHSEFVKLASEVLGLEDRVNITNAYYEFDGEERKTYDLVLLLNVLHHLGDDYGYQTVDKNVAKAGMIKQLNSMAHICNEMVFQLGFNWKGDRHKPLFDNGTKKELIDFVSEGIKGHWDIQKIAVPFEVDGQVIYQEVNDTNIQRNDSLGEFLNRPLFILKSLV